MAQATASDVTLQRETVAAVWDEALPLLKLSWREVGEHPDAPSPSPEVYAAAERAGLLHVFTARFAGALVGVACFSLVPSMHRPHERLAKCDTVFVHPTYRDTGCGFGLLRFARDEMTAAGAAAVYVCETRKLRIRPVLESLGFAPIETVHVYRKERPHG